MKVVTVCRRTQHGAARLTNGKLQTSERLSLPNQGAAFSEGILQGSSDGSGQLDRCPAIANTDRLLADDSGVSFTVDPIAIHSAFALGITSAVAKAICLELAQRGCRCFHLVARDRDLNQPFAWELEERFGASVSTELTDLTAAPAPQNGSGPQVGDFDLYLITAGSLGDAERAREDGGEALRITAANYTGLLRWLTAIATPDRLAKPGRLWVFSSVAADRGRPSNYHYGAAKAALTTFCEGLLLRCHGKPFAVRILKAGFMATPMTVGKAPPALCAPPEAVARDLLRRPNRRGIEYIPWWWGPFMLLIRLLPAPLASKL